MRSAPKKKRESGALKEVWQAHNELVDFVREIAPMPSSGSGVRVTRTSNGTLYHAEATKSEGVPGEVVRMRISSILDDYVVCQRVDDGSTVNVAKPFNLRRSGWHGVRFVYRLENYPGGNYDVTIDYTHISSVYREARILGGSVEHQVIRPFYIPGISYIFASKCEGTGVGEANEWVDVNADGRAWTMVVVGV